MDNPTEAQKRVWRDFMWMVYSAFLSGLSIYTNLVKLFYFLPPRYFSSRMAQMTPSTFPKRKYNLMRCSITYVFKRGRHLKFRGGALIRVSRCSDLLLIVVFRHRE